MSLFSPHHCCLPQCPVCQCYSGLHLRRYPHRTRTQNYSHQFHINLFGRFYTVYHVSNSLPKLIPLLASFEYDVVTIVYKDLDACTLIILCQMYMFPRKIKKIMRFGQCHKIPPFTIVTIGGMRNN